MKVGDLVKFQEDWKATMRNELARCIKQGVITTTGRKAYDRIDKLALVTQDWDIHNNFAVIFLGETEEIDFNDEILFSDQIMELVYEPST